MKKVGLSDTVFPEGSRRLCVERVHLRVSPAFLQGNDCEKSRKTLGKNGLKSLHISISGMGLNPGIFAGLKIGDLSRTNPKIPRFSSRKNPGKIPFNFRPFPENFLLFLCQLNLHNPFSRTIPSHSQNQGKN